MNKYRLLVIVMMFPYMAFLSSMSFATELEKSVMTQVHLESLIKKLAQTSKGGNGVVEFEYSGVILMCISDTKYNRMRIIAPIGSYAGISPQQKDLMLAANFHTALDARYAVSQGVLYAAFIHPLSSLQAAEVVPAVRQVATLMQTFGSLYTSGELNFGGAEPEKNGDKIPL